MPDVPSPTPPQKTSAFRTPGEGSSVARRLTRCINQPSVTIGQAAITSNAASDNQYRTETIFVARSTIASTMAINVPCHTKCPSASTNDEHQSC